MDKYSVSICPILKRCISQSDLGVHYFNMYSMCCTTCFVRTSGFKVHKHSRHAYDAIVAVACIAHTVVCSVSAVAPPSLLGKLFGKLHRHWDASTVKSPQTPI